MTQTDLQNVLKMRLAGSPLVIKTRDGLRKDGGAALEVGDVIEANLIGGFCLKLKIAAKKKDINICEVRDDLLIDMCLRWQKEKALECCEIVPASAEAHMRRIIINAGSDHPSGLECKATADFKYRYRFETDELFCLYGMVVGLYDAKVDAFKHLGESACLGDKIETAIADVIISRKKVKFSIDEEFNRTRTKCSAITVDKWAYACRVLEVMPELSNDIVPESDPSVALVRKATGRDAAGRDVIVFEKLVNNSTATFVEYQTWSLKKYVYSYYKLSEEKARSLALALCNSTELVWSWTTGMHCFDNEGNDLVSPDVEILNVTPICRYYAASENLHGGLQMRRVYIKKGGGLWYRTYVECGEIYAECNGFDQPTDIVEIPYEEVKRYLMAQLEVVSKLGSVDTPRPIITRMSCEKKCDDFVL